jgi:hypothetical protein
MTMIPPMTAWYLMGLQITETERGTIYWKRLKSRGSKNSKTRGKEHLNSIKIDRWNQRYILTFQPQINKICLLA